MRKTLFVVAALIAALTVGAAGAYFTAQAQVPENVIRAGTFAISTEPTSAALSIDALAPGMSVTKPVVVLNDGVLPAQFVVTAAKKAGITEFYDALLVRVTSEGTLLYDGSMLALRTTPLTVASGARKQLDFAVSLPATAGNELAGDYAKLTLYVDAEQVR
ncbi:MAG: TasA family protein [Coriobacteriia bacterium]|nr:TasA family protein [Coriobacteriia bacterium]